MKVFEIISKAKNFMPLRNASETLHALIDDSDSNPHPDNKPTRKALSCQNVDLSSIRYEGDMKR